MANGAISGPPAVDFYSMLSGLGDTIAANRASSDKKAAYASALTPGPDGKVDFGKAILGLAQVDPHAASVLQSVQAHNDSVTQADRSYAHTTARDKIEDDWADTTRADSLKAQADSLALQRQTADRLANPTPAGFVRSGGTLSPLPGGPADPSYITAKAKAEADASVGKLVPFETLSGTKFLSRQPNGTYATVDPASAGSPAPGPQPQPSPQPQPAGAPPAPVVAPGGASVQPTIPGASPPVATAQPDGAPSVPGAPSAPASGAAAPSPQQSDLTAIDPQTGRREGWLKAQSPEVQDYIKKVADYQIDPRTSSTKGGHREQIMSAVAQYDPTYDQNTFGSRAKAVKDFSTGAQGNSIRSFDVATDHLDTLQKYVEAAKNGDYRVINSLRQKWLQETGSPLPTNIQAVAPIVGAEVSKAIIGSNNALADREELRKPLNGANSPEQLMGAIQAYKALMTGQLKGLGKQYEDTTGRKDFNSRLRENTRSVLLGGDGSAAGSSSSQPNVTSTGVKWSIQ